MARRKKSNKNFITSLLGLFFIILILTLFIPAIGVTDTSPDFWVKIVEFFESIRIHFESFWMFYTFAIIILFVLFSNRKR